MILAAATASDVLLPFAYCLVLVIVAVVFLKLNDWIFHRSSSKSAIADFSKRFEERLCKPDLEGVEKHFGHALPESLKAFYRNTTEILKDNFEVLGKDASGQNRVWLVAYYQPADLESVRDAWPDTKPVFEFADDGCGNGYTIDPRLDDPPVMFYDHETGEWEEVAKNFSEFLSQQRPGSSTAK